jgi:hypothetical protein
MGYAILLIYVVPLLTIGVARLLRRRPDPRVVEEGAS